MALATINNVSADAHARRVTLNLVRHSVACPSDLRAVLNKLAATGWAWNALSSVDMEQIFATVDAELCEVVKAEYEVDTSTMRDYGFPYWRDGKTPDWFVGEHEVDCRLCGHKHNRYEFLARNTQGGGDIWMGSTCIRKFGIVVDGEATAEAAYKALSSAMAVSKKAQKKHKWQTDNPYHAEVMSGFMDGLDACETYMGWRYQSRLPAEYKDWRSYTHALGKALRGAVNYYRKNGYLTDKRTEDVFNNHRLRTTSLKIHTILQALRNGEDLSKAIVMDDGSIERDPIVADVCEHWQKFIDTHTMNDYQKGIIRQLIERVVDPESFQALGSMRSTPRQLAFFRKIVEEVTAANAPKPVVTQESLPF